MIWMTELPIYTRSANSHDKPIKLNEKIEFSRKNLRGASFPSPNLMLELHNDDSTLQWSKTLEFSNKGNVGLLGWAIHFPLRFKNLKLKSILKRYLF